MEQLQKGEVLILDNDKEYLIADVIEDNGNRYAYLVLNTDDENNVEIMVGKEILQDAAITIEVVKDMELLNRIMQTISSRIEE